MTEITPSYYKKFICIGGKCKHNCCIGWEIDIDEDTLERYNSMTSPIGERIRENIDGNPPHFVLGRHDRCPFLNDDNLCDIIIESGEESLCEICRLHPRFRNFYENFCETGLGLCCEEAVRIILNESEQFQVEMPGNVIITPDEQLFFEQRKGIFDVLQNREMSVAERFYKLALDYDFEFDFDVVSAKEVLLSLERLDEAWTRELEKMSENSFDKSIFEKTEFSVAFEQLSVYFVFRHLPLAMEYFTFRECVKFALLSCFVIGVLWHCNGCTTLDEKALDIVRMYSSEIEYSEENTEMLMYF